MNNNNFPYCDLLLRHYLENGDIISSIRNMGGHEINSINYKIVFSNRDKKPLHLKIIPGTCRSFSDKLSIFFNCSSSGVKTARIVPTKTGKYHVEHEQGIAVCFSYYEAEPYNATDKQKQSAARQLGKLNKVLSKINQIIPRSDLYKPLNEDEITRIKKSCKEGHEFEHTVLANLDMIQSLSPTLSEKFSSTRFLHRLEHCDFHPENIVFQEGNVAAILDFDSICSLPRNLSVAFACDRFSENSQEMIGFIKAYQKTDQTLGREEVKDIPDLIKWEALCRLNYILRTRFFEKNSNWNFDFEKHVNIINKAQRIEKKFISLAS